ncbi:hypothetical protein [Tuberibacillus sp. Marseille-P3662]|uniref:hypothetical protein n=1 Tax=Tuberibacillus sp. Marseille-P3662 TaxID=1965358 RepID=UPI000A1CD8CF|nr:hypothetical protein [Tuberibacillus sp. Marseille-P3662]
MIDFILDHKWIFFIAGEVIFWVSLIGFILLRYALNLPQLSRYLIGLWLASDLWLITIGVLDYMRTGSFQTFQLIILIFVIYALTAGKKDFQKLDRSIKRLIAKWKGTSLQEDEIDPMQESLYGLAHAMKELKNFGIHILIYGIVMAILVIMFGFKGFGEFPGGDLGDMIDYVISHGFIQHPTASKISGIWTLVLGIDAMITVTYFIFPKKAPGNKN